MQILTILIAAIGILIVPAFRRSPADEEDDDVGLFIGSARPLPANPQVTRSGKIRSSRRSQKRIQ